jgi:hypothetical protein
MATRKLCEKDDAVYFATFTCHRWLPLFQEVNACNLVYEWMRVAHGKGYHFFGYAIMPNHAHFVLRVTDGGTINS